MEPSSRQVDQERGFSKQTILRVFSQYAESEQHGDEMWISMTTGQHINKATHCLHKTTR